MTIMCENPSRTLKLCPACGIMDKPSCEKAKVCHYDANQVLRQCEYAKCWRPNMRVNG